MTANLRDIGKEIHLHCRSFPLVLSRENQVAAQISAPNKRDLSQEKALLRL